METWLDLSETYAATLVGSAFFGKPNPADIDIMIGIPAAEIPQVEQRLLSDGWLRNQVDPSTRDEQIVSSFRRGKWDLHLATPEGWKRKRAALLEIRRQRLHVGKSKPELYRLYADMCGGGT